MYEYTFAIVLLFFLWLVIFLSQSKLHRKVMLFSGFMYATLLVPLFWFHKIISLIMSTSELYNPAYWKNVSTLFNLNNLTGGFSIEDTLFMVFWGGIASILYEWETERVISISHPKKSYLPIAAFVISYLVLLPTRINPIYLLIIPSLIGGLSILLIRKDLVINALSSASLFTIIYFLSFFFFTLLFPDFVTEHYNIPNLSGVFFAGVPLEDLLYAITFAFMWGPIYKVVKGKSHATRS